MPIERHHIIHENREWENRPEGRFIRRQHSLIIPLERETHKALHENCPPVPVLGYHALKRVQLFYEPGDTPLESVDNLLFSIEEASKHPRSHSIERSLAELSIQAIDLQRPYLKG